MGVQHLVVDPSSPFPIADAMKAFGESHGFQRDAFDYAGKLVPVKKPVQ